MAGAVQPSGQLTDGKNLVPLITKGIKPARDVLFWHYPSETGRDPAKMASAVRKGDFKLLQFYRDNRLELYNLKTDPGEKIDLNSSMPSKRIELLKLLEAWKKEVNAEIPQFAGNNTPATK
ncbi:MAG TPA: sulfatase/phosphatase domain-containing protein [Sphingobacteriaceae bacterium]|nr:sulfatase/phosphatase domain-containing protein [Sphingobacteriaceae bacterium]